jgi:poly-gamma-glutamate synthesis protein (capsule biosynthesis protein)
MSSPLDAAASVATTLLALQLIGCDQASARNRTEQPVAAPRQATTPSASAPAVASNIAPPPRVLEPVRLTFVGDVAPSLNVGINLDHIARGDARAKRLPEGYPFSHVRERLALADLAIGNLECVASSRGMPTELHAPLQCPLALAPIKNAGIDLLSVANNHAMDFGEEGYDDMLRAIPAAGLAHFGSEAHRHRPQRAWTTTIRGVRVGLLAYYQPPYSVKDVLAARSDVDVLAVFLHWGLEGETKPLALQRAFARELVDAGVDLVVGTHAHVVQDTEIYKGKLIAYGLGNFVFSGMGMAEVTRIGAMLEASIHSRGGGGGAPPAQTNRIEASLQLVRLDDDGAPRLEGRPKVLLPARD